MQHGVAPTLTGASVAFTLKDTVARSIADFLEKSPSTILREIQKHSLVKIPNTCDCNDYNGCNVKHVCGSKEFNKKGRSCHLAKKYCEYYNKRSCEHWKGLLYKDMQQMCKKRILPSGKTYL